MSDPSDRRTATVGAFLVAGVVGLLLEVTVLSDRAFPLGVQSLCIALGAAAGTWVVWRELF